MVRTRRKSILPHKEKPIGSTVPVDTYNKLAEEAKKNNRSISKEIKQIIETHLNEGGKKEE